MVQCLPPLDAGFGALSEPTRRGILERLGDGEASISTLADTFGMTLTGIKKHVQVLEGAGLVSTEKIGRVRRCRLGPRRLDEETAWIAGYRQMLEARLDSLGDFLERTKGDAMSASQIEAPEGLTLTTPSDREIRTERVFDAPRGRVWRALTEPGFVAQWWGRGNRLVIERFEPERGGHWRFVEHSGEGAHGFEGRFREVTPIERIVQTFEWDGMPGYVAVDTMVLEDLGDGRTKLVTTSLFHTPEERDGMLSSGMATGLAQSYAALDRLLTTMD